MSENWLCCRNGDAIALKDIPEHDEQVFAELLAAALVRGERVSAYFATETGPAEGALYAICADDRKSLLSVLASPCRTGHFVSLATQFPQVQLFEREIYEQTGLVPKGHPWLKPVRFPRPGVEAKAPAAAVGEMDFFRMGGAETHEVAVGPVHAGIIEPGHFRFQCHGETVFHLEISLGYQHRGLEKNWRGGPHRLTPFQMEAVAGDTTAGHAAAYAQLVESLSFRRVSPYTQLSRALAVELERCANHIGDLGALAGDIGYLPTMSYCGRIRGDFLNMTAALCGNRFSRGLIVPGGNGCRLEHENAKKLAEKVQRGLEEFLSAAALLWDTPSVLARFEGTGKLEQTLAGKLGLVGPAARACGIHQDVRQDHVYGYYRFSHLPVSSYPTGDVFARAFVRWLEVKESAQFVIEHLLSLPREKAPADQGKDDSRPEALSISMVEGWRGEICHVAITDRKGRFRKYKIVDPSFHNWPGLAMAMRGEGISNFPLCNKSFNLSYCGFDL